MTIDKAINALLYYDCYDSYTQTLAREKAIETMRKYQHITEIVEAWKADIDVDSCDCMEDIEGVLNGNDD